MVVRGSSTYMILGSEFILANPSIIKTIIEENACISTINNVETTQNDEIYKIIKLHECLFQTEISSMNLCTTSKHTIDTIDARPVRQVNFRVPINWEKDIEDEINKNLRLGIIQESKSDWCSRIVPVAKKDGKLRLCIDFRALNGITVRDSYPIPRIDMILDKLSKSNFFSILDATSGYFQIALDPKDIILI